jgi:hypothetical protein
VAQLYSQALGYLNKLLVSHSHIGIRTADGVIFKCSVRTSKRDIIAVYCEVRTEYINIFYGQNTVS